MTYRLTKEESLELNKRINAETKRFQKKCKIKEYEPTWEQANAIIG